MEGVLTEQSVLPNGRVVEVAEAHLAEAAVLADIIIRQAEVEHLPI
jgi:hypothetical protein